MLKLAGLLKEHASDVEEIADCAVCGDPAENSYTDRGGKEDLKLCDHCISLYGDGTDRDEHGVYDFGNHLGLKEQVMDEWIDEEDQETSLEANLGIEQGVRCRRCEAPIDDGVFCELCEREMDLELGDNLDESVNAADEKTKECPVCCHGSCDNLSCEDCEECKNEEFCMDCGDALEDGECANCKHENETGMNEALGGKSGKWVPQDGPEEIDDNADEPGVTKYVEEEEKDISVYDALNSSDKEGSLSDRECKNAHHPDGQCNCPKEEIGDNERFETDNYDSELYESADEEKRMKRLFDMHPSWKAPLTEPSDIDTAETEKCVNCGDPDVYSDMRQLCQSCLEKEDDHSASFITGAKEEEEEICPVCRKASAGFHFCFDSGDELYEQVRNGERRRELDDESDGREACSRCGHPECDDGFAVGCAFCPKCETEKNAPKDLDEGIENCRACGYACEGWIRSGRCANCALKKGNWKDAEDACMKLGICPRCHSSRKGEPQVVGGYWCGDEYHKNPETGEMLRNSGLDDSLPFSKETLKASPGLVEISSDAPSFKRFGGLDSNPDASENDVECPMCGEVYDGEDTEYHASHLRGHEAKAENKSFVGKMDEQLSPDNEEDKTNTNYTEDELDAQGAREPIDLPDWKRDGWGKIIDPDFPDDADKEFRQRGREEQEREHGITYDDQEEDLFDDDNSFGGNLKEIKSLKLIIRNIIRETVAYKKIK